MSNSTDFGHGWERTMSFRVEVIDTYLDQIMRALAARRAAREVLSDILAAVVYQ
jgi:hypothetical protein